jgi:endonuclease/exonuclease/phosphatase (EEP) superfamily protein YafD
MKEYSFTTYNIFKIHFPFCKQVIGRLCEENDFVAFQEWISSVHINNHHHISTCATFTIPIRNVQTGTTTVSKVPIASTDFYYSKGKELGFVTRKSMLVTSHNLDGKELFIFNCHALNFVTNSSWYSTIDFWISQIPHSGSVIFAGDFNTWNPWRFDYLERKLEKLGFVYAHYNHNLILRLDHIFVRNIEIVSTKLHENVHTSDHYPVTLRFRLQA